MKKLIAFLMALLVSLACMPVGFSDGETEDVAPAATPLVLAPNPQYCPWGTYTLLVSNATEDAASIQIPEDYVLSSEDAKLVVVRVQSTSGTFLFQDFEDNTADFELRTPDDQEYPVAFLTAYGDPTDVIDFVFEIPSGFPVDQCKFLSADAVSGGRIVISLSKLFDLGE